MVDWGERTPTDIAEDKAVEALIEAQTESQQEVETRVAALPAELRNKIWSNLSDLLRAALVANKDVVTHLVMDDTTSKLLEARVNSDQYFFLGFDGFEDDMSDAFFWDPLVKIPELFREFFAEVCSKLIFSFEISGSFEKFANGLRHYLPICPNPPLVHVAMFVFDDAGNFLLGEERGPSFCDLAVWEETNVAHGYWHQAGHHVIEWMDGVKLLPATVHVHFIMRQPWRDYVELRKRTAPLRERGGFAVGFVLREWVYVSDVVKSVREEERHAEFTFAAVTGCSSPRLRKFSGAIAEDLVGYGCRF